METNKHKFEGIEEASEEWNKEILIDNFVDDFYSIAPTYRTKARLKKMFKLFIKQLENEKV